LCATLWIVRSKPEIHTAEFVDRTRQTPRSREDPRPRQAGKRGPAKRATQLPVDPNMGGTSAEFWIVRSIMTPKTRPSWQGIPARKSCRVEVMLVQTPVQTPLFARRYWGSARLYSSYPRIHWLSVVCSPRADPCRPRASSWVFRADPVRVTVPPDPPEEKRSETPTLFSAEKGSVLPP
jgi:hypothetical protein